MSEPSELERLRVHLDLLAKMRNEYNEGCTIYGAYQLVKSKIANLEADQADPWRMAKETLRIWGANACDEVIKNTVDYVSHIESDNAAKDAAIARLVTEAEKAEREVREMMQECKDRADERDKAEARIAELEARPVPPLDPKRVIATACKVIRESDPHSREKLMLAGCLMMEFKAGNAGIYPLAGDDEK